LRLFVAPLLFASLSLPSVLRADTITIKGGGDVITFSLPSMPNTDPSFLGDVEDLPDSFTIASGFGVNVNGFDSGTDFLVFARNAIVLSGVTCLPPDNTDPYCSLGVAFVDGDLGSSPPLFNGPDSDPTLNLGTYSGFSGSSFPYYGTLETLTISSDTSPVPEPSSIFLFATGLLLLIAVARRFRVSRE